MTLKFPILSTPDAVSTQIINNFIPSDLVTLSFCSKKSYKMVKCLMSKSIDWKVTIYDGRPHPTVRVEHELGKTGFIRLMEVRHITKLPEKDTDKLRIVEMNGHKVQFLMRDTINSFKNMVTYWDDQSFGVKLAAEYCLDLFGGIKTYNFSFNRCGLWLIEWSQNRHDTVVRGFIEGRQEDWTEEQYLQVLRNFKPTTDLGFYATPPESFTFTGPLPKCDRLFFLTCCWMSRDTLMTLDSICFNSWESKLNSSDFNHFLKHWLTGGFPRLRNFITSIDGVVRDEVIMGFEDKVTMDPQKNREYIRYDKEKIRLINGYTITRDDGVISTFKATEHKGLFIFVVWPDFQNNHCL